MLNFVRTLRKTVDMTQQRFAERVGTSQPTIAQYESGAKSPTLSTARGMAQANGFDIFWQFVPRMMRAEYRSLLYHERIVEKLLADPESMIAHARAHVQRMSRQHPQACALYEEWSQWLDLPLNSLCMHMVSLDLHSRDMRQVSPFSELLTAQERKTILKRLRKELR